MCHAVLSLFSCGRCGTFDRWRWCGIAVSWCLFGSRWFNCCFLLRLWLSVFYQQESRNKQAAINNELTRGSNVQHAKHMSNYLLHLLLVPAHHAGLHLQSQLVGQAASGRAWTTFWLCSLILLISLRMQSCLLSFASSALVV